MDNEFRSDMPYDPEAARSAAHPRPIWCWQGLICVGLLGVWTAYLLSSASYPFRNTLAGLITHFLVMAVSLLFGGLEFRKLFQERDTTPGLVLAFAGIIGAIVVSIIYLQSYGVPIDDCCHGA